MPEATTLLLIFFTSFLVGFSGAIMPGPLLTLDISETVRRGFWAGPSLVLGHGIVEVVIVAALSLGLSQLLGVNLVAAFIGLFGGLFLFWMAWGMIRGAQGPAVVLERTSGDPLPGGAPVLAGALVSIFNPYWVVWWATVGASYVFWALEKGSLGLVAFYGGHILSDLSWYTLVSLIVARGRRVMNARVYRGILTGCALFLVGMGIYFVVSGVRFLG